MCVLFSWDTGNNVPPGEKLVCSTVLQEGILKYLSVRGNRGCYESDCTFRAIVYCSDYFGEKKRSDRLDPHQTELELRGRNFRHNIRENFVISQLKRGETLALLPPEVFRQKVGSHCTGGQRTPQH